MSTPYASHRLRNGTAGILLPLRSHRQTVEGSTSANSAACASEYPAFTLAAFNVIFISSHHPIIFVCAFQVVSAFSVCQRVSQSPALYNSQRSMSDRRTLSDCVLLLTTLQQYPLPFGWLFTSSSHLQPWQFILLPLKSKASPSDVPLRSCPVAL